MKFAWSISTRACSLAAAAASVLLLISGCATVGSFEEETLEAAALTALPADRTGYVYVNAASAGGFLNDAALLLGAGSRQVEAVLDNLSFLYFALDYPSLRAPVPGKTEWICIGTGSFPVGAYASALNFDRDWNRVFGSGRYWISADGGIEIALPGRQTVVAGSSGVRQVVLRLAGGDDSPGVEAAAGTPVHPAEALYELISRRGDIGFAAYLREPSLLLPVELPPRLAEGVVATLAGDFKDGIIEAELGLNFSSKAEARIAGVLIKTLIISELRKGDTGAKELPEVVVEEQTVSVRPMVMTYQDALFLLAPVAAADEGGSP